MTTTNDAPATAPSGSGVTAKLLLEWADDFAEAAKKFERLEKCVLLTRAQECRDAAASLDSDASQRGEPAMLVDRERLREKIAADPDLEYEVRPAHPAPATAEAVREALEAYVIQAGHYERSTPWQRAQSRLALDMLKLIEAAALAPATRVSHER